MPRKSKPNRSLLQRIDDSLEMSPLGSAFKRSAFPATLLSLATGLNDLLSKTTGNLEFSTAVTALTFATTTIAGMLVELGTNAEEKRRKQYANPHKYNSKVKNIGFARLLTQTATAGAGALLAANITSSGFTKAVANDIPDNISPQTQIIKTTTAPAEFSKFQVM